MRQHVYRHAHLASQTRALQRAAAGLCLSDYERFGQRHDDAVALQKLKSARAHAVLILTKREAALVNFADHGGVLRGINLIKAVSKNRDRVWKRPFVRGYVAADRRAAYDAKVRITQSAREAQNQIFAINAHLARAHDRDAALLQQRGLAPKIQPRGLARTESC